MRKKTKSPTTGIKKHADNDADVIEKIIVGVGVMLGSNIDTDTIRYFTINALSESSMPGLSKGILIAKVEDLLQKRVAHINNVLGQAVEKVTEKRNKF